MASPRIGIVGPGLIGTSIALAAIRRWPDVTLHVVGQGHPVDGLRSMDIVVLAAPVEGILALLPLVAPVIGPGTLVLDAGSTKRAIVTAARQHGVPNFVGGHPMAGAAMSGPLGARADLFDDNVWFLVGAGAPPALVTRAEAFVSALGARPIVLPDAGEHHDRVMAAVSHLPQLVATTLLAQVGEAVGQEGLAWAGRGLRDTTRLASSPASMWTSILATNADEVAPLLDALGKELQALARELTDPAAVTTRFARAAPWTDP